MSRPRLALTIRQRLLALGIIPLVALLVFGGVDLVSLASQRSNSRQVVELVDLSADVSGLVHDLQVERGLTSAFVSSKGARMKDKLPAARQATDASHQRLATFLDAHGDLPAEVSGPARAALATTTQSLSGRQAADGLATPAAQITKGYTAGTTALLAVSGPIAAETTDADLTRRLSALGALSRAQEATGIERAQFATVFATGGYAPGQRDLITAAATKRAAALENVGALDAGVASGDLAAAQNSPAAAKFTQIQDAALAKTSGFGNVGATWFADATAYLDELHAVETRLQSAVGEDASAQASAATLRLVLGILALTVVALLTLWLAITTVRSILRSLREVETVLTGLRDGRLDQRVRATGSDELAQMSRSLDTSLDALEEAMRQIRGAADRLSDSSRQLSGVAEGLRDDAGTSSAEAQAASASAGDVSRGVDALATAGEELKIAIREIARSANSAQSIVEGAVAGAQEAASTVSELEASSSRIEDVLKSVAAISEQTNLLALNATIEAARAGEAGKGFAVVANEVKELAQETTRATEDIGRRIEQLRGDTRQARERIDGLGTSVAEINSVQSAIAAAVEEQTATTASIGETVGEAASSTRAIAARIASVAEAARRTDGSATSARGSADDLATLSGELTRVVERFRLSA